MLRAREKNRLRRILFGKVAFVILLVLFVLLARGTWNVYQKSAYAQENRERAEQELAELNEREAALRARLEHIETQRGLEEEIRHTYDVGREGEQLIVLVEEERSDTDAEREQLSMWQRIVSFFGFE